MTLAMVAIIWGGLLLVLIVGLRAACPPTRYDIGDINFKVLPADKTNVHGEPRVEALSDMYKRERVRYFVYLKVRGKLRPWRKSDYRRVNWEPFVNFMIKMNRREWVGK